MNLLSEYLPQCTPEYGEVLAEDEHLATVDGSPPGDDTVGIWTFLQSGGVGTVTRQEIKFVKAP